MPLARREKLVLIGAGLLLVLVVLYQALARPAMQRIKTLERLREPRGEALDELQALSRRYAELKAKLRLLRRRVEDQPQNFSIPSFLERMAKECGVADNVDYMRPSRTPLDEKYVETAVEAKMEKLTLEQVIEFLLKVHSTDALVGVKELELKKTRDGKRLDMTVRVSTLSRAEDG